MGKEDKQDSGFGFKDRAKAEETLKLLEQHDPGYRRLTVRGLLGRAKRVLSMTKAEDKIKNIKEAMEVFETWLADLASPASASASASARDTDTPGEKRPHKDSESESEGGGEGGEELPSESVSGLGFKDEAAARGTLAALAGRDPDYQQLAVKGLLRSAKRVLSCTKDETKLSNIKAGSAILEQFLDDYESQHLSRQHCPYLPLGVVRTATALAGDSLTEHQKSFVCAYARVRGQYKRLRNVPGDGATWDVLRNSALKQLKDKYNDVKLFNEKDEPTKEHLQFLVWAYSPDPARVKKLIKETKEEKLPTISSLEIEKKTEEKQDRKRKSSVEDESQSKKKKE